jgi:hypothetical protein
VYGAKRAATAMTVLNNFFNGHEVDNVTTEITVYDGIPDQSLKISLKTLCALLDLVETFISRINSNASNVCC